MPTKTQAIATLRALGRHADATWVEQWKNVDGGNGGWDAALIKRDPTAALAAGLAIAHSSPTAHPRKPAPASSASPRPTKPRSTTSAFTLHAPRLTPAFPLSPLPTIAHADWSTTSTRSKRQLAWARPIHEDTYELDAPSAITTGASLVTQLLARAHRGEPVLVGFDFAIGVPLAYARAATAAGIPAGTSFLDLLARAPDSMWDAHDDPAALSCHRPFFPRTHDGWDPLRASAAPGELHHAVARRILGAPDATSDALLRLCDRAHSARSTRASAIFLLSGANQVGKAAVSGWREVLAPLLRDHRPITNVWPYDGDLADLVRPSTITIVETYPAESYAHLGFRGLGKGDQTSRRAAMTHALDRAIPLRVRATPALRALADDGFGPAHSGEDPFDATVGALALAYVALGHDAEGRCPDPHAAPWEGWILGRPPT